MEERRVTQRRKCASTLSFPLRTGKGGLIACDRRSLPTRRVNDIEVHEISYRDFLTEMQKHRH
jgi:hypothetical protein